MLNEPIKLGHWVGFKDLTELHNEWIKSLVQNDDDETLLAHRSSYKTTCVSLAMSIDIALFPNLTTLFMRKTDTDVMEVIAQTKKILSSEAMQFITSKIYGKPLQVLKSNSSEIKTNLVNRVSGTAQLLGIGVGTSITGKHFDRIRTDDICNLKDRISKAEREHTKQIYYELQNVKNRGGKITNTATPWHKDDVISTLMPNIQRYDCYATGLMTKEEIEEKRGDLTPSLFAANYGLEHIASENALFESNPVFTADESLLHNGIAHIDAAYGGEDGSAFTLAKRDGDKIYMLGKLRKMHIDKCLDSFLAIKEHYKCGSVHVEDNADKGYLAKEIRNRKEKAVGYHESMNKYLKISTYLRKHWKNIIFLEDTDPEYINEILDYTEDAEHDDSPDSAASIIRKLDKAAARPSLFDQLGKR